MSKYISENVLQGQENTFPNPKCILGKCKMFFLNNINVFRFEDLFRNVSQNTLWNISK